MSGAALIEAAASGRLPDWAAAHAARREHMARVAELMDAWAVELDVASDERVNWRAAAWLHDALRDADPGALRLTFAGQVDRGAVRSASAPPQWSLDGFADWPVPLLHGPAVAARLGAEGVTDPGVLRAVAYHTVGHPDLDRLGRALYLADFLEHGRTFEPILRAALRARMPAAMNDVLGDVVAARMRHLIARLHRVRPETVAFWNSLAECE